MLIAVFAWSVAEEARQRSEALTATQLALAREQQLSALGGQAAAVAHLLGTPLATINVIAKELVRELPDGSPLAEEAGDLLAQAQRCRELLAGLGKRADDDAHRNFTRAPFTSMLEHIAGEFARPGIEVRIDLEPCDGVAEPEVTLTPELRHSLANLIDNAIQYRQQRGADHAAADTCRIDPGNRGRRPRLLRRSARLAGRALSFDAARRGRPWPRYLHRQHLACPNRGEGSF